MSFSTEKQLKEYGDKLPADKKSAIESALTELKSAHSSQDLAGIDAASEKLNAAWQAASQDIYAQQGAQQAQPNGGQQAQSNGGAQQAEDVEFEEVK